MNPTTNEPVDLTKAAKKCARILKAVGPNMFWDIQIEESEIIEMLRKQLEWLGETDETTVSDSKGSVISCVINRHEEFLCDAVREQCRFSEKQAAEMLTKKSRN